MHIINHRVPNMKYTGLLSGLNIFLMAEFHFHSLTNNLFPTVLLANGL